MNIEPFHPPENMKSFVIIALSLATFNGGSLALPMDNSAIARRGEDFSTPWIPPAPPANGAITATGENSGYNYGGNGANGGTISIGRREEDSGNFFFPYRHPAPPAATGAATANGANGGMNYYGNSANGGAIPINRRAEESEDEICRKRTAACIHRLNHGKQTFL